MLPKTDSQIVTPRKRGRRRAAIVLLVLGLWGRSRGKVTTDAREHREPNLWDDGFGAT